jgi:hypothetical protein
MQLRQSTTGRGPRACVALAAGLAGLLLLSGCRHHGAKSGAEAKRTSPAGASESDGLRFQVREVEARPTDEGEARAWTASYDAGGKTARFRIELILHAPESDSPIAFTTGSFARESGSDPSQFLKDLGRILEAKAKPKPARPVDRLTFTAALLGTTPPPAPETGAGASPAPHPGHGRIATKIFVADGAGEFYLNLESAAGVGEILMKDPDYGETVVKELSRVL